jgi:hypothetical protein
MDAKIGSQFLARQLAAQAFNALPNCSEVDGIHRVILYDHIK